MKSVLNLFVALAVAATVPSFASASLQNCCTKGCCAEVGIDRTLTNGKQSIFVKAGEKAYGPLARLDTNPTKLLCKMGCCKGESVTENRWNGKRNEPMQVKNSVCTMPTGCCEDSCGKPVETSKLPARWIDTGKSLWHVGAGKKAPKWLERFDTATKTPTNCCSSGKNCCAITR